MHPTQVYLLSPNDKWIGFSSEFECLLKLATQVLAVVLSFIAAIHVGYLILEVLNFSSSSLAETRRLKRRLFALECAFLVAVIIIVSVRGADTIQFLGVIMICIGLVLFLMVQRKTARLCNELQTRLGANAAARDPTGTDKVFSELRRLYGFAVRSLFIGFVMLVCDVGTVTLGSLPSFHDSCAYSLFSSAAAPLTRTRLKNKGTTKRPIGTRPWRTCSTSYSSSRASSRSTCVYTPTWTLSSRPSTACGTQVSIHLLRPPSSERTTHRAARASSSTPSPSTTWAAARQAATRPTAAPGFPSSPVASSAPWRTL